MRIAEPQWTPDGTTILLVGVGGHGPGPVTVNDVELAFVDPAGGEPVFFTPTSTDDAGSATDAVGARADRRCDLLEDGTMCVDPAS